MGLIRKIANKLRIPKQYSSSNAGMTRRDFLVKAGLASASAVAGTAAVKMYRANKAANEKAIAEKASALAKAGIDFSEQWGEILNPRKPVYNWTPETNVKHRKYVDIINKISSKTGVPVANVLRTIEVNEISEDQVRALDTKISYVESKLADLSGERKEQALKQIKRLENIKTIVSELVKNKKQTAYEMLEDIRKTRGSKHRLDRLAK